MGHQARVRQLVEDWTMELKWGPAPGPVLAAKAAPCVRLSHAIWPFRSTTRRRSFAACR